MRKKRIISTILCVSMLAPMVLLALPVGAEGEDQTLISSSGSIEIKDKIIGNFEEFGDEMYYFLDDGSIFYTITGWATDLPQYPGKTFYFDEIDGHMVTGWREIDGDFYYFYENHAGSMYRFNSDYGKYDYTPGAMHNREGFFYIYNLLYKFDDDGKMLTGWQTDEWGDRYYFRAGSDGTAFAIAGWFQDPDDGKYYHFCDKSVTSAHMDKGWFTDEEDTARGQGRKYYLDLESGEMKTGMFYDEAKDAWYFFNDKEENGEVLGEMETGWVEYEGDWYYFYEYGDVDNKEDIGKMVTTNITIEGITYYFTPDGKMTFGL